MEGTMEAAIQNLVDAWQSGDLYRDPFPIWDGLRELAPLVRLPLGGGMWLSTRWANTSQLARDPRLSSARGGRLLQLLPPESRGLMEPVTDFMSTTILWMDPPRHARIRKLVGRAFSPEVLDSLRPRIEALFGRMLEDWIRSDDSDIVASLL